MLFGSAAPRLWTAYDREFSSAPVTVGRGLLPARSIEPLQIEYWMPTGAGPPTLGIDGAHPSRARRPNGTHVPSSPRLGCRSAEPGSSRRCISRQALSRRCSSASGRLAPPAGDPAGGRAEQYVPHPLTEADAGRRITPAWSFILEEPPLDTT